MWPWCKEPVPFLCSLLMLDPLDLPVGHQKHNPSPLDSPSTPRALFPPSFLGGKFCLRGEKNIKPELNCSSQG